MTNTITLPRINSNLLAVTSFILIFMMMFLTVQPAFAQGVGMWIDPCEDLEKKLEQANEVYAATLAAATLAVKIYAAAKKAAEESGSELARKALKAAEVAIDLIMDLLAYVGDKAEDIGKDLEDCREEYPDPPYFFLIASNGCVSGGCGST